MRVVGAAAASTRDPSDAALIARSLAEPDVFSAVFERHFAVIHRYLARRAGRGCADDLAAQTFVVAFDRRGTFREEATSARPWLFGIATNVLRNELRSERRMLAAIARLDPAGARDQSDEVERTLARADAAADAARIAGALALLDSDQRDVLLLHAWGELSNEEIADSLGVPAGTVRSRLSRARATLQRALAEDSVDRPFSPKEESR